MRNLTELKTDVKELLSNDIAHALLKLKTHLKPHTASYDEVIIALERCNRLNKALQKGMLSYQEADILFNQVINSAISIINDLQDEDLI